jgi:hypothetical protein
MPTPMRIPAGFTQDNPTQPLANLGVPDPFFCHTFATDFDALPTGVWTTSGTATIVPPALIAGDGGIVQFATETGSPAVGDFVSAQLSAATFTAPASAKRMFFLVRFATNFAQLNALRLGMMAISATPFTGTPDGIYFTKSQNSLTSLALQVVVGGVVTGTVSVPTTVVALANNTYFDLGFEITASGEIKVFGGTNLVGFRPQSGTAAQTTPPPVGGPVARFRPSALPVVAMSPTLGVQAGAASQATMNVDFVLASKER